MGGPDGWDNSFGSPANKVGALIEIKHKARAAGANAVSILERRRSSGGYSIEALLLDMIDVTNWPRIGLTEDEIKHSFDARGTELDEIEGIWESRARTETYLGAYARRGSVPIYYVEAFEQRSPEEQRFYRIAIVKAVADPLYPYAAYILNPEIPEWQAGFLKGWLRKMPASSGYEAIWYRSTFQGDRREFHPDESGTLKTSTVVMELCAEFSIEQTLTKVYPPKTPKYVAD